MKYTYLLLSLLFISTPLLAASSKQDSAKSNIYIKLRETKLRSSADYLAAAVGTARFGEALTVLTPPKNGWIQVSAANGKRGFVHSSAVSDRKIVLASKSGNLSNSFGNNEEIVLAGKGFSAEVEKGYAAKNAALNFAAVDQMEKLKIGEGEVKVFVKAGGLGNA